MVFEAQAQRFAIRYFHHFIDIFRKNPVDFAMFLI